MICETRRSSGKGRYILRAVALYVQKFGGTSVADYLAVIGREVLLGILRRDAGLYRVAVTRHFILGRDADLIAK